jgi:hypothetical protein
MPIISTPILIGGAVAAALAVSQYKPRSGASPTETHWKRFGIYTTTFLPGVIVAQAAYGALKHYHKEIASIEGAELLTGALVGGFGLRLLLSLYKYLPQAAMGRIMGLVQPSQPKSQEGSDEI